MKKTADLTSINIFILVMLILLFETFGFLSSFAMTTESMLWYAFLNKSSLNPPPEIFAPVWSFLYLLLAVAFWRLVTAKDKRSLRYKFIVVAFVLQLALNYIWTFIFFAWRMPFASLIEMIALCLLVVSVIVLSYKRDKIVLILLLPYIIWLGLATYLTYYVVNNNLFI